jgi:hypothetical protein
MRFTIRDLLWLMVVASLSIGLWITNQRAMSRENAYKLWAFDIAVSVLKEKTGDKMTVNEQGVWILHTNGTADSYHFKDIIVD